MNKFVIAITGGIASGKSFVCQLLSERNYPIFSCDEEARNLMIEDIELRQNLMELIGRDVYKADGTLNKSVIITFLQSGGKATLDALIHPYVRRAFLTWSKKQEEKILIMECALLFESGFDTLVNYSILVSASETLRLERLMRRNNINLETARWWLDLQLSEEAQRKRVDAILYNNGKENLEAQLKQILSQITI